MNVLNTGTRISAMLLDHAIMTMSMMIIIAPGIVSDIVNESGANQVEAKLFLGNIYLNILGFSLYFNKDIFHGRSPAKRILNLQIVDIKTNKPANALKCLFRNITIPLWPLEVIITLINKERRLGDIIAGTKLTVFNTEDHRPKTDWPLVALAVILGVAITYLLGFYPLELLTKSKGFL